MWRQSGFEEAAAKAAALAEGAGDEGKKKGKGGGAGARKKRRRVGEDSDEEEEGPRGYGTDDEGAWSEEEAEAEKRRVGKARGRKMRQPRVPPSTMLLTGAPGSGKTALCYATAQKLGFEVIEINASQVCMHVACVGCGFVAMAILTDNQPPPHHTTAALRHRD